ncbi:glycosyltransferase [Aquibacillus albus]|uniref:Glycosyltransferase involved in cell wall biosynthesis n=1 Tax=Aquibacillus albus TaxID=1168171 RepID=A0ABS2N5V0_9BACI|nr:glycosyltransferase [Aquibacillus albus]MBM7573507.1 glycosyltransferase involved in cell wall biosynthesis [Aquibacillus albus]
MKIFVNATANDDRGPLSLTQDFLRDMVENNQYLKDKNIHLYVLVSKKELEYYNSDNLVVKYDCLPKKSFFHKYYYERVFIPEIMIKEGYDVYLSLQNTSIKKGRYKQVVLIHSPLPFENLRLGDIDYKIYFKYRVLLRNLLKLQCKSIDNIIVQTHWMKKSIEKLGFKRRIEVVRPNSRLIINKEHINNAWFKKIASDKNIKLIYPTNRDRYKNNRRLIKSVEEHNKKCSNSRRITLYLTIDGPDTDSIKYIGKVDYNHMYNLYKLMDALVFPSLTETLGLPLLEAEQLGLPRIVADREYARDVCKAKAYYFNPLSIQSIELSINSFISHINEEKKQIDSYEPSQTSSYLNYIEVIEKSFTAEYHSGKNMEKII